jgi:HAD superfamily hydrolase (TIGR01509 family)
MVEKSLTSSTIQNPKSKIQNRIGGTILSSPIDAMNLETPIQIEKIAPKLPYAALIFDCDGTLADTLAVHFQTWTAAFQKFGAELPEAWFYERTGLTASEFIQAFNHSFNHELDIQLVDRERRQFFQLLIHQVKEVQAVAEIARSNAGKVPMAIASNGNRQVVESTIEAIKLRSLFTTIVTLEDVAAGKPAPDLFLLAAHRMDVTPENCIVYEDSDNGLEAAWRAGMRGIDVRVLWQRSS